MTIFCCAHHDERHNEEELDGGLVWFGLGLVLMIVLEGRRRRDVRMGESVELVMSQEEKRHESQDGRQSMAS